jgi:phosphoribosylformylglycinamidine synthase
MAAIAGLCNEARNIVGLMPHPERACESTLGSSDGLVIFESAVSAMKTGTLGESKGPALQAVG